MSSSTSTSTKCPVKLILGLAVVGDASDPIAKYTTPALAQEFVDVFRKRGYKHFDTARLYSPGAPGSSEEISGKTDLAQWATIDTKVKSFVPGSHNRETILESVKVSLEALHVTKLNVEYLHAPDRSTPFEETCGAINEAYQAGHLTHFGLSNYSAQEVEEFVAICDKHGWVKPSVYQGQYSAVVRGGEPELFSVLRKHKIAFYAWSPAAGGFFSDKISRTMALEPGTRWDQSTLLGQMCVQMFHHDALFDASERVRTAAKEAGLSGHAAALRWAIHHSQLRPELGDGVIIGASSLTQLRETIDMAEAGPLPDHLVKVIEDVWPVVKDVAPAYYFRDGPRTEILEKLGV
ncbi:MAG: hypothetical protein M1826_002898 [Phylliscum demangeonii]|nr:MAG: hypothetical protein M1826_002898 [Phylliscum demangeonii]